MKLKDTIIAYNPGTAEIAVGPLLSEDGADWTRPYSYTIGAAFSEVRELTGMKARHRVMSDFIGAVVRDGVDIDAAHEAFSMIEEYLDGIPHDLLGGNVAGNKRLKIIIQNLEREADRRMDALERAAKFLEIGLPITALEGLKDDLRSMERCAEQAVLTQPAE